MFSNILTQSRMYLNCRSIFTTVCNQKAREGTRAKKRARFLKLRKPITRKEARRIEIEKRQALLSLPKTIFDNEESAPDDDVYFHKWFKAETFKLEEAIDMHREIYHPTIYNNPDQLVSVTFDLDMKLEKKNKNMKKLVGVAPIFYKFLDVPDKKVLVLAKSGDIKEAAIKYGAHAVGGAEIVKKYQNGSLDFTSFSYVIAHPDIMDDITALRGILKTKYPVASNGSVTLDIPFAIRQFQSGIEFESEQRPFQEHIGNIVLPFAKLSMPMDQIRSNFSSIANYIASKQVVLSRPFITRARVWCRPYGEIFLVDHNEMIVQEKSSVADDEADAAVAN